MSGSGAGCLRNPLRGPVIPEKHVRFQVEAYDMDGQCRAACQERPSVLFPHLHSVMTSPVFLDEWGAVGEAFRLQQELFLESQWDLVEEAFQGNSYNDFCVDSAIEDLSASSSPVNVETASQGHSDDGIASHLPAQFDSCKESLRAFFEQVAWVECEEQGPVIYVRAWFLRSPDFVSSSSPRVPQLDGHVHEWWDELQELWRDRIDRSLALSLFMVLPSSPAGLLESPAADVILTQAVPIDRRAVLGVSVVDGEDLHALPRCAALVSSPASASALIDAFDFGHLVGGRDFTVHFRDVVLQEDRALNPGLVDGGLVNIHVAHPEEDVVAFLTTRC